MEASKKVRRENWVAIIMSFDGIFFSHGTFSLCDNEDDTITPNHEYIISFLVAIMFVDA